MKMEVLVQQQYQSQYGTLGSNKVKDWIRTFTPPSSIGNNIGNNNNNTNSNNNTNNNSSKTLQSKATTISKNNSNLSYLSQNKNNKIRSSINKNKINRTAAAAAAAVDATSNLNGGGGTNVLCSSSSSSNNNNNYNINNINNSNSNNKLRMQQQYKTDGGVSNNFDPTIRSNSNNYYHNNSSNSNAAAAAAAAGGSSCFLYCDDDVNVNRVNELSLRLLDELRAAKSQHLACTEVSLPCDLTQNIASEILRISEKEPCGIRGCTIFIEFENEPNNSRRIATLKLDAETVSTFEVYLTLQQDHRGWTSLLPQFMKSLTRTITISPKFQLTKHKLYTPYQGNSLNDIAIADTTMLLIDGGSDGSSMDSHSHSHSHNGSGSNISSSSSSSSNSSSNSNINSNNNINNNNSIAAITAPLNST